MSGGLVDGAEGEVGFARRAARVDGSHRPARRWRSRAAAAAVALVALVLTLAAGTWSWRSSLVAEERLLAGTNIAGVDVGGWTVAEAEAVATRAGETALAREVVVAHAGRVWSVSPGDLGATHDADGVVAAATSATASASWPDLVRTRWLGRSAFAADVRARVDDDVVARFVELVAQDVDTEPEDATAAWGPGGLELVAARPGAAVDRPAAVAAVRAALEDVHASEVALPVEVVPVAVSTGDVERVWPALVGAVETALEREITIVHDDAPLPLVARDIGAVPVLEPVIEAARAEVARAEVAVAGPPDRPAAATISVTPVAAPPVAAPPVVEPAPATAVRDLELDVPLTLPDDELDTLLDVLAAMVGRPALDAAVDSSTGWIERTVEQAGQALDRDAATARLLGALAGERDTVDLPLEVVEPEVTLDDLRHVLLVRQDERRLYLYTDGEITHDWPVAVGAGGSPTPTGEFTIGAKRRDPTWYNSSPNGWGANMPRVIGPGPSNPLGVRALNWMRDDGSDTLIRFHGTAATSSIGQAASRGCVRLTNPDVVELFDLVPSGAKVVSLHG